MHLSLHHSITNTKLDLQVTVPSENQEMIAMNCTVEPGLSELIRIEVNKKSDPQEAVFHDVVPVGSIDAYQSIQSHNSKIIVEGHLDKTGWTMSYLSVTILRYECTDDRLYYCIATGSRSRLVAEVDVKFAHPQVTRVCNSHRAQKTVFIFPVCSMFVVYRFSPSGMPTMNPDLAKKGVSVRGVLDAYFSAGTCEDTGVYRCKQVYQSTGEAAVKVVLSEARLLPCYSLRVVVLVSLEVSVVRNGTRRVLAYINSFLNEAKVSHESSDVRVVGEIHPYNPTASSLNVTSELTSLEGVSLYITTCTAVYSGNETKGTVVNSMADARVRFQK
ncbi:hypothetical protein C0Q70_12589 [Pomacea canaliculata]|uniref:Uncharacterized protein n=1 Tax=Pomacea canaliculata TaxID=400727 RepID=A0A2T7P1Y6_POMCA|nr:hypothetical protein C0Q70_12589 [Pomacea canaliculata]